MRLLGNFSRQVSDQVGVDVERSLDRFLEQAFRGLPFIEARAVLVDGEAREGPQPFERADDVSQLSPDEPCVDRTQANPSRRR